jgi:alkylation response protein AidB-like acyl-CoA dehydrogenase
VDQVKFLSAKVMTSTTDELNLLAQTKEFATQHLAPLAARLARERLTGRELHLLAADIGLLGLQVPLALGGRSLSFGCKVQAAEILAAADFGVAMALINTHNVAEQLARLGNPGLAQRLVPALVSGQVSACTALTEPSAGSDFSAIQMQAQAVPGGWQLEGVKSWITNAAHAEVFVVYAQTSHGAGASGIAAFVVEAKRPGFQRQSTHDNGPIPTIGSGGFRLAGYCCTEEEMLSPPGEAFKDILGAINGARTYVGAMCCGMAGEALRVASGFGHQRQTFGKSLLGHQGWRWQLADAAIDLEAARLMVSQACTMIDAGQQAQSAAAKAKVFATRMAQKHLPVLMHAMGAEGLSENYPFVRHLAAAQIAALVDGSTEMLLERIAKDFHAS